MNAIVYSRVSSKEQVEGTSLDVQAIACMEYARGNKMLIIRQFVEEGESAKFADRPRLLELIDFCKKSKGQINTLLVWKLDRLARNVSDHFSIKAALLKYGVKVVSVTESIGTNPEGQLMETILAGFAQFDNDVRSMRTVHGMRKRIRDGIQPWCPPLGYKSGCIGGEKKNQPDVEDQPTFDLLKKAWERFATGAYTKADMRRLLRSLGATTRRGEPLTNQAIDNLFKNPFYAGILTDPWSKEEFVGQHRPMVSREDFARVQQVIFGRNRSIKHLTHHPEFPLRGIVRCPECEHKLTGSISRGRSAKYPYYHCGNPKCPRRGKTFRTSAVGTLFSDLLTALAAKDHLVEPFIRVVLRQAELQNSMVEITKAQVQEQISKVDRQLEELIKMRARNLIDDADFELHRTRLRKQRLEHLATLHSASDSRAITLEKQLPSVREALHNPLKVWTELKQPASRNRFCTILFPLGLPLGSNRTVELGPLFKVEQGNVDDDLAKVPLPLPEWNRILQDIQGLYDIMMEQEEVEKAN